MADYRIKTVEEYRELRGDSHQMIYDKSMTVIDEHIHDFLALSTFLTVASIDAEGRMDVSPKGDPPGFVKVVDEGTIAIPERGGNRRADTFTNVLQIPSVGLIFFVPGMDETMRINGTATLTTDPELLATMKYKGHTPSPCWFMSKRRSFTAAKHRNGGACGTSMLRSTDRSTRGSARSCSTTASTRNTTSPASGSPRSPRKTTKTTCTQPESNERLDEMRLA